MNFSLHIYERFVIRYLNLYKIDRTFLKYLLTGAPCGMGGEWSSDSWCIKIYGLDQRKMEAFTHSFPEFQIAGNNHPTVDYMNFQYLFLTCPAQPTKIGKLHLI